MNNQYHETFHLTKSHFFWLRTSLILFVFTFVIVETNIFEIQFNESGAIY